MKEAVIIISKFPDINVSNIINVSGERKDENNNEAKQKNQNKQKQT